MMFKVASQSTLTAIIVFSTSRWGYQILCSALSNASKAPAPPKSLPMTNNRATGCGPLPGSRTWVSNAQSPGRQPGGADSPRLPARHGTAFPQRSGCTYSIRKSRSLFWSLQCHIQFVAGVPCNCAKLWLFNSIHGIILCLVSGRLVRIIHGETR